MDKIITVADYLDKSNKGLALTRKEYESLKNAVYTLERKHLGGFLSTAVIYTDVEMVDYLVGIGVDIENKGCYMETPVIVAMYALRDNINNEESKADAISIIEILVSNGADIEYKDMLGDSALGLYYEMFQDEKELATIMGKEPKKEMNIML